MSIEHEPALAIGRNDPRTIRRYLEALQAVRGGRARSRSAETVRRQLQEVRWKIVMADPEDRARLAQERISLEAELEGLSKFDRVDLATLEAGFIACAATYSTRNGITYAAWREAGIAPKVLKQAGIAQT
jgi:hypothetical protein